MRLNNNKDKLWLIFKGILMGAANKVPGVSGGIVAVVFGFYQEFISSMQKFNRKGFTLLFSGKLSSFFKHVNGVFLTLLFSGMIISYFSVSKILDFLIARYEVYIWSLFFGMIIGSIIYIYTNIRKIDNSIYLCCILGIFVGFTISILSPGTENKNIWFVFFCGVVSISGMTLPGFSGSFILMLLGNYVLLLVDSVNVLFDVLVSLFSLNISVISDPYNSKMLKILSVFTIGSLIGLIILSHILNFLLKKFEDKLMATIMGFIIGSLSVVWPWKEAVDKVNISGNYILDSNGNRQIENYVRYFPELNFENFCAVCLIILGVAIVLIIKKYEKGAIIK